MTKRNQHIVPHPDGWAVKPAGGEKASSVHSTQRDAIDRGREVAHNQKTELRKAEALCETNPHN